MLTRLRFAAIAGIVGLVLGCIVAAIVKTDGESFPTYIIVAFTATFAVSGAIAKKDWLVDLIAFFVAKFP